MKTQTTQAQNTLKPVRGKRRWVKFRACGPDRRPFFRFEILHPTEEGDFKAEPGDMMTIRCVPFVALGVLVAVQCSTFGPVLVRFHPKPGGYVVLEPLNGHRKQFWEAGDLEIIGVPDRLTRDGQTVWESPAAKRRAFTAAM